MSLVVPFLLVLVLSLGHAYGVEWWFSTKSVMTQP